ncbi:uncharacterized protein MONOS_8550 [Monocercomonoides exilis]|uniref:uncharacterized protein n=1 Tax=Monocercomonoides exilis TaxID=2049356 RepID=UPI00355A8647|nr:hypothetical protein MONOS_8550 [Monocercomonoides exilis]|eukprot:MONOS_8550.1-p1 / transcript=MONOS_8550.1 / gene=MONOS_8550 / organism=Monocercomonoides_exilis_PA203 / gene_product=unspecified product / transcript_product=unspecified product / location=Mono_scaffold00325:21228-21500(+) / protein_length=91 / sequence_SO=supercontig / SO=protein_coding / is_pseudo=false
MEKDAKNVKSEKETSEGGMDEVDIRMNTEKEEAEVNVVDGFDFEIGMENNEIENEREREMNVESGKVEKKGKEVKERDRDFFIKRIDEMR